MPKRAEKLFSDIIAASEAAQSFVIGRSRQDFAQDLMLRSAVERQLEIVGEAIRRLRDLDPVLVAQISDYRRIIDFRNILAHGYDVLSEDVVWQVLSDKLPLLQAEVRALQAKIISPRP
jgi:uncharacterized protein with HEPN domain